MSEKKRILILTADAGFGHRSAANAVAAALDEIGGEGCQVEIVNPLEDRRAPFFLRDSGSDYDKMVRSMPELYKFGYDASDAAVPTALVETALVVLLFEIMRDLVKTYRPDAILSTYPLYQAPVTAVFTVQRVYVPFFTVVTDLVTVHRLWFHRLVDACLVPNNLVADLAMNNGMPFGKIRVTGLPVNPEVVRERRPRPEIRLDLGWRPDLTTILAVGSRRVERLIDAIHVINHFGTALQLSVVAGKDEELYRELVGMDWHLPSVHLYEYSDIVPTMMHASDALVCKAGGLIVTEALACGLPLMLVDVIPGQETGNADYVLQGGAGDLALDPVEMLEVLAHWTADGGRLLRHRAENAARLGRPHAAYQVAEILLEAAGRGPYDRRKQHIAGRPNLIDTLTRNNVPWRERVLKATRERRERKEKGKAAVES